ncbi:MAG: 50S ribosomal protein L19e [Thermoplasmata archaeon]|nr:50S ribosomal protein L19e [Thermoplasmata archaeon]
MDLRNKRRLAAEILGCGVNRVYIDPSAMDMVYEAVSRDDIRYLINEGVIKARQKKGVSRGRARMVRLQKMKGKRRGPGSRKGRKYARLTKKERWMNTIRPIRRRLRELRDSGEIDRSTYRRYYRLAKGGTFKNTAHLESHLAAEGKIRGGES